MAGSIAFDDATLHLFDLVREYGPIGHEARVDRVSGRAAFETGDEITVR